MTALDQATLHLAKQLIACRSITPDDGGALALLEARLSAAGFACERIDRGVVKNLWARHGTAAPLVCLAGHVDVVPPGPVERWTSDPFVPAERDGFLFGRGAADMKVGVAALTTAAERFVASTPGHRGSLALLFTSDEEGAGVDGTRAVVRELQTRGERIDACILAEPTSVAVPPDSRFGATAGSERSWPAQKPRPVPVTTTHRTLRSPAAASSAARSSPCIAPVKLLSACGRFNASVRTRPESLTRTSGSSKGCLLSGSGRETSSTDR